MGLDLLYGLINLYFLKVNDFTCNHRSRQARSK